MKAIKKAPRITAWMFRTATPVGFKHSQEGNIVFLKIPDAVRRSVGCVLCACFHPPCSKILSIIEHMDL